MKNGELEEINPSEGERNRYLGFNTEVTCFACKGDTGMFCHKNMLKRFDHFARTLVSSDGIALDYRSLSPQQSGHPAFSFDDFYSTCAGGGRFALGDLRGGVTLMSTLTLRPKRFDLLLAADDAMEDDAPLFLEISNSQYLIACSVKCNIKVFRLPSSASDQGDGGGLDEPPYLLTTYQVKKRLLGPHLTPPTVFTAHDNSIALGFQDGQVVWLRIATNNNMDSVQLVQWMDFKQPVTALGFVQTHLFVAGESKVSSFDGARETVLDDEFGCALQCGIVHQNSFVTAREDRIQFFSAETPGSCYSIPGNKLALRSMGGDWLLLVVVTMSQVNNEQNKICQVLDLTNKFIAHEFALIKGDSVCFVACDEPTGCALLLTKMKKLWRLRENPIETRLNDLIKRNLFPIAIRVAKTSNKCDLNYIADLHRRFAEHLYEKKNYEDAATQFCSTIGRIEPSYVIRRFLDSNRVANLVVYLEALHDCMDFTPSADHTTLLLTCYSKMKREDKIVSFIEANSANRSFDVAAALQMLKDTGRIGPALKLAKERNQKEWYVNALLEHSPQQMSTALDYIRDTQSADLFFKHACRLVQEEEEKCLQVAKHFHAQLPRGGLDERILDAFLCSPNLTLQFCRFLFDEYVQEEDEGARELSPRLWNTLLEVSLRDPSQSDWTFAICSHAHAAFDVPFALFQLHRNGDFKSLYFVLERLGRFEDLLKYRLEETNWNGTDILHLASSRFADNAQVWKQVLTFFANNASPKRDFYLRETLRHIEQHNNIIPALIVLDILAECTIQVNLGTLRAYLVSQMELALKQSESDRMEVDQLRQDTERMHRERILLESEPKVFNATTCCLTGAPLELPVVHFFSGNSYNLASLPAAASSKTLQDPKCAQDQNSVFDIAKSLAKRRTDVDEEFFSELQLIRGGGGGEAGFSFIADYFGKCLFDEEDNELEGE